MAATRRWTGAAERPSLVKIALTCFSTVDSERNSGCGTGHGRRERRAGRAHPEDARFFVRLDPAVVHYEIAEMS
jgi:hypothetical protein